MRGLDHLTQSVSRLQPPPAERDARAAGPHLPDGGARTPSDVIEVPLSRGYVAIIDAADAWLLQWKWSSKFTRGAVVYAQRAKHLPGRKTKTIFMHREILGDACVGFYVDHLNGDGLDNRRANLRMASAEENARNIVGARAHNRSSGVLGVARAPGGRKWTARIMVDGKRLHLGTFDDVQSAELARLEAEARYWGIQPRRQSIHDQIAMEVERAE